MPGDPGQGSAGHWVWIWARVSDIVATLILSRGGVKLGLARGSELADPKHLLAGSGKVHRHIAFTELDEVGRPGVRALLRAAYATWQKRRVAGRTVRGSSDA